MALLKSSKDSWEAQVDFDHLPRHVAIIMDGNGRWAKRRGLPRTAGHAAGAENFRTIATYCQKIGLEYLTVYAFSTENWKRPLEEVSAIMGLLKKYLLESIEKMERDKVKMHFFGDLTPLPQELREMCERTEEISKRYDGIQLNVCLNYGGRDEIVRAARAFAADCAAGTRKPEALTEADFSAYLYSAGVPDPDLVIRPSGEIRISNFLLWQSAYAELYYTDVLWPDFSKEELHKALVAYQGRSRRYGGV
ncbi:isoprenyl transferase [uncultured Flavonifractor sp.]|uniref:isoprenyl transferase n=1 Tax=uncultured Flavonifractor sp. TaxID=1193534 RepID=UPI00261FC309|nr:isoprenyl transferase [uncultured Flavonifractor sp.]